MNLKNLEKTIPYRWRVQSFSKNKPSASCIAYVDARDVMNLLDEVVGKENWQDSFKYEMVAGAGGETRSNLICGIGIKNPETNEWVWKHDTGVEGDIEKEKAIFSDAFKRAAVKWGVGRFLYDLDIQYVNASEVKTNSNYPYPVDDKGKRIWDLTVHINNIKKKTE